jgi:hypothetical protein
MARRRLWHRFRLPDRNKKYCVRLWAILKTLGLTRPVDVRMYIDGVGTIMIEAERMPKIPGKRRRYRILPIKTLASPLCVIDFLDFLMGYWKVVMGTGLTKKQLFVSQARTLRRRFLSDGAVRSPVLCAAAFRPAIPRAGPSLGQHVCP